MTRKQQAIQVRRFLLEEQMWRAAMELGELSRACQDHVVIKGRTLWSPHQQKIVNTHEGKDEWHDGCFTVSCAICGIDLGWHCPKNPKGYCEYDESNQYGCKHCGDPEERK